MVYATASNHFPPLTSVRLIAVVNERLWLMPFCFAGDQAGCKATELLQGAASQHVRAKGGIQVLDACVQLLPGWMACCSPYHPAGTGQGHRSSSMVRTGTTHGSAGAAGPTGQQQQPFVDALQSVHLPVQQGQTPLHHHPQLPRHRLHHSAHTIETKAQEQGPQRLPAEGEPGQQSDVLVSILSLAVRSLTGAYHYLRPARAR